MFVRVLPAIGLFFLAPLVAEFLLGDFPITMIAILFFMAPMYGGGAILIREFTRRTGRGWPTIVTLALAYGILEEAFTTQSLFNPNYLGLNLHLLDHAFIPALGISAWWTVLVLTLHTIWSISVPIALIEALVPDRAEKPWLGCIGLGVVAALYALAVVAMTRHAVQSDHSHFMASRAQFVWSGIACAAVAALAFIVPREVRTRSAGDPPNPWLVGGFALAVSSIFELTPPMWNWWAVIIYLALDVVAVLAIVLWASRAGWGMQHCLALAGGAAMTYAWHAFVQTPVVGGGGVVTRVGNAIFALGAVLLLAAGFRKLAKVHLNAPVQAAEDSSGF